MRRLTIALLVGIAAALARPARAQSSSSAGQLVYVVDASSAIVSAVPQLPAALIHDVVTTPIRAWHVVRGLATDVVDLVAQPPADGRGLFRNTLKMMHDTAFAIIRAFAD